MNNMNSYQAGHSVPNVVSSIPYISEYCSLYYNGMPREMDYEYNAQEDPVFHASACQNNNSKRGNSNLNFSNSDSDSYYTGSRPSSTQLNENEIGNNYCSMNVSEDATYLLSLPNSNDWTLASSLNHPAAPSPASSSYADSRSSPVISEMSFYDDMQTFKVPEGGRRTPPPPYRPPVNNTDISYESAILETIYTEPPPPYVRTQHSTTKCGTNSTLSGSWDDSGISENFPLTADRTQSAAATSGNWTMSPSLADFQTDGFPEQRAVEEASTEVLVPGDPELWNKEHISHWLTRIENYYRIGRIDRTRLPEDGVSLCCLSTEDFHQITGDLRTAEILSNYLDCLKQNVKFSSKSSQESTVKSEQGRTTFFEAIKQVIGKSPRNKTESGGGGGQIQLWQFLLELLVDPKHSSLIAWEDDDGTFRLLDPEGTAKLWGQRKFNEMKSKKPMNYDKLSRSLRHYYMKGIVNKVCGRRYTYKFHLDGLLRACSPSGVSDSIFIYPNFDPGACDNSSPRNFNLNVK